MSARAKRPSLPGRRSTPQRRLLLDLLEQADGHLDAGELYLRAREIEPAISLSTVYRNLRLFREHGLIEERHLAEDHHHYEAKTRVEHHHLVCLGCGRIVEFVSPLVEEMKREIGAEHEFAVTGAEVSMSGYCSRCRQGTVSA
jgi:Fur family ferric uptake transcriptional regulator